jgi:hypothetical protein
VHHLLTSIKHCYGSGTGSGLTTVVHEQCRGIRISSLADNISLLFGLNLLVIRAS